MKYFYISLAVIVILMSAIVLTKPNHAEEYQSIMQIEIDSLEAQSHQIDVAPIEVKNNTGIRDEYWRIHHRLSIIYLSESERYLENADSIMNHPIFYFILKR